jgi:hypothetical protein
MNNRKITDAAANLTKTVHALFRELLLPIAIAPLCQADSGSKSA